MIRKDIIDALHPRIRIRVLFKPILIDPECVQKYLNHMGFAWKARWALAKIFTYDLLPSCFDWILQLDTDTIFSGDVKLLWDERTEFSSTQLLGGVAENQYNPRNMKKLNNKGIFVPDTNGFNSGVLVMSTHRMKLLNFAEDVVLQANTKLYPDWAKRRKVDASKFFQLDQDVFNTALLAFPELRYQLSVKWNIQGCASFNSTAQVSLRYTLHNGTSAKLQVGVFSPESSQTETQSFDCTIATDRG
eukprot:CAMPEP_0198231360 /NCGR_PEP_ID=MMETSP1445-20131203/115160_1 /TAXON_ID=36898 /ORGANISM="Pyramimonas sp., Strain CCMP2087" /LENGTH=245 /DNA_ID=CAMNT_0043911969 /DNA_START=69 /DNA_END=807 /DNA_ORIENTATION=+